MGIIQGGDPLSKDPAQARSTAPAGLASCASRRTPRSTRAARCRPCWSRATATAPASQFFIASPISRRSTGSTPCSRAWPKASPSRRRSRRRRATDTVPDGAHRDPDGHDSRQAGAGAGAVRRPTTRRGDGGDRAVLETSLGDITVEFFPDRAPNHVRQFLRLAASGVYDGTAFHRVVKGFVDPGRASCRRGASRSTRQQQAYVRTLQPEFNATPHDAASCRWRGDDPASATSSFFIVLARTPALDGKYTVFGRVVAGHGRGGEDRERSAERRKAGDAHRGDRVTVDEAYRSRTVAVAEHPPARTRSMLKGSRDGVLHRLQPISIHGQLSYDVHYTFADEPDSQARVARVGGRGARARPTGRRPRPPRLSRRRGHRGPSHLNYEARGTNFTKIIRTRGSRRFARLPRIAMVQRTGSRGCHAHRQVASLRSSRALRR